MTKFSSPGFPNRALAAAEAAGENGVDISIDHRSEVYGVHDRLWKAAGMTPKGGCLCIGCLEKRLGRKLRAKDFPRGYLFNMPGFSGTPRLKRRRG
jgi:hypothetical protein